MWGRAITLTRLGGFDIRIDASWLPIAALITWSLSTGYFPQVLPGVNPPLAVVAAVISMLGLFASLVLHELAHSVVARRHGLRISGITLFLFGGVAEMEREPEDPSVEIRVALVGPLASLGLAAAFWLLRSVSSALSVSPALLAVLGYLAAINLTLALFNLVPAFPLDGGRVFRAVLWRRGGDLLTATRRACGLSAALAWGMIALGLLAIFRAGPGAGVWPVLLGLFLLYLSRAAWRRTELQQLVGHRTVADLMTHDPVVARPDQTLAEVVNRVFLAEGIGFAPVVEDGRLLGYVDLHIVRRIDREHWATATADDVVEGLAPDNSVAPGLTVEALVERMARTGRRKFLVVEQDALLGVVTLSDVAAHLDVSRQIAGAA